jgi:hypothetical protein
MIIAVFQRLNTYIDDGTLASLLMVVDPTDDGHHGMHERAVIHTVLTMKASGLGVVFTKQTIGINEVVTVAEKSVNPPTVFVIKFLKCHPRSRNFVRDKLRRRV